MLSETEAAVLLRSRRESSATAATANAIIARKNETISECYDTIDGLRGQLATKDQELAALKDQLAKFQRALGVEQAHAAGLLAEVRALRKEHSDSPLNKPTGKAYKDGTPQVVLDLTYEQAFDAKATGVGFREPSKLRDEAK